MSHPVGDSFEWPDKHVPFGDSRGWERDMEVGGDDDDPTGCAR
jgi:hypothetical protein